MLCRKCLRITLQLGRSASLQAEQRTSWQVAANPSWVRSYTRSFPEAALTNRNSTAAGLSRSKRPSVAESTRWMPRSTSQQTRNAVTLAKKPEEPEEPDVFNSGEPTVVLTERAEQVSSLSCETFEGVCLPLNLYTSSETQISSRSRTKP
jgi:hypothetical protein